MRDAIREAARKYVEDPNPTVIVKEIKSRRVFITGQIEKPGPYPLNGTTTILQLIAMAGGLREFVDGKNISLMRSEKDRQCVFAFNYQDVVKKKIPPPEHRAEARRRCRRSVSESAGAPSNGISSSGPNRVGCVALALSCARAGYAQPERTAARSRACSGRRRPSRSGRASSI